MISKQAALDILDDLQADIELGIDSYAKHRDRLWSLPDINVGKIEQLEWIPCSERLPLPDDNPVIVSWMGVVNIGWYSCGRWETGTRLPMDGVEAWMPMPSPYEVKE